MFPGNQWLEKEEMQIQNEIKMNKEPKYQKLNSVGIFYFCILFFLLIFAYSYSQDRMHDHFVSQIKLTGKWICPSCGYKNYDEIRYCPLCGSERSNIRMAYQYEDVGLSSESPFITREQADAYLESQPYLICVAEIINWKPFKTAFLIMERKTKKFNCYITEVLIIPDIEDFVKTHEPLEFEKVIILFPEWHITNEQYGF